MSELINAVRDTMPWLFSAIAWIAGLLILLLLVSIPAYFWFWPFWKYLGQQTRTFRTDLVQRFAQWNEERREKLVKEAEELQRDGGLVELVATNADLTLIELRRGREYMKGTEAILGHLDTIETSVQDIGRKVPEGRDVPGPDQIPDGESELPTSNGSIRRAWLTCILTVGILSGLMLVNTGMLSQILRDLGVVPATMTFLGVPLSYVFAFFLTLVEGGLGVAHAATRVEHSEKLNPWPILFIIFAVIVATVEGFFYSRIASSSSTFALPFVNHSMTQSDLFFLWGFVLVMTLFSLGMIAFRAGASILEGNARARLLRQYIRLQRDCRKAIAHSQDVIKDTVRYLQGSKDYRQKITQELGTILPDLDKLTYATLRGVQWSERSLSLPEIHNLSQKAGVWLTLTVVAFAGATWSGIGILSAFGRTLYPVLRWLLAIGQPMAFLCVGFLLGTGTTIAQIGPQAQRVISNPTSSRIAAYVLGSIAIASQVIILSTVALPQGGIAIWIIGVVMNLLLVASGYQLLPLIYVVRLFLLRVWGAIARVFQGVALVLVWLLHAIVVLMVHLCHLLSAPIERLSSKRGTNTEPIKDTST